MQTYRIGSILFALVFSYTGTASDMSDAEALALGYRVAAVKDALQNPGAAGAMQAITDLGHEQRYYIMVRGWLMYQLQSDKTLLSATRGQSLHAIRARVDFIQQAIRAIDLE
jgi:hypothetical protein